ncbi:MAG: hypothetical protein ABIM21_04975 [candidate division WOR-3 bacterium]
MHTESEVSKLVESLKKVREKSKQLSSQRVELLCSTFLECLKTFERELDRIFPQEMRKPHFETIDKLQELGLQKALDNNEFLKKLYETVCRWMARGKEYLVEEKIFREQIKNNSHSIMELEGYRLLADQLDVKLVEKSL